MTTPFNSVIASFYICERVVRKGQVNDRELEDELDNAWDTTLQDEIWSECGWKAQRVNVIVTRCAR